jgi:hypothetical protein
MQKRCVKSKAHSGRIWAASPNDSAVLRIYGPPCRTALNRSSANGFFLHNDLPFRFEAMGAFAARLFLTVGTR